MIPTVRDTSSFLAELYMCSEFAMRTGDHEEYICPSSNLFGYGEALGSSQRIEVDFNRFLLTNLFAEVSVPKCIY